VVLSEPPDKVSEPRGLGARARAWLQAVTRRRGAAATIRRARRLRGFRHTTHVSGEGLLFVALALLIGLAAINTGTNLLYLILAIMISMLLHSFLLAWINLSRLRMSRLYPLEFHAGETVQGQVELRNGKRLWGSYAIGVVDFVDGPANPELEESNLTLSAFGVSVAPRGQIRCPVQFTLPQRGLYLLHHALLTSRYPFGLFERSVRFDEPAQLLVYPRLLSEIAIAPHLPSVVGELAREKKGPGSGIHGIRAYREGDPQRQIHWKHSARGQGLMVKEMEQEQTRSYRLMLDLRRPHEPAEDLLANLELAVSLAATLARMLLRQECRVGLWTSMGNVPAGVGRQHLKRILRALAQVSSQPAGTTPVWPEGQLEDEAEIWIDYYTSDDRAARFGTIIPRRPGCHVIDIRRLALEK